MSVILGLLALALACAVFRAASDVPRRISPQGCRMSWMSPSYLLQKEFDTSWTPLASRYSLWLYREVGWEPNQAMGLPVLFIPGNAGSSHQVRSIASSAARQYFSSPFVVSPEFTSRGAKPVDVYAVEFNEDLSAFHGATLDAQIAYASAAVDFVLSRYPPDTEIVVMGHSMGGVVGTALLPSANVSALITMSTPHTLPPARFDARIQDVYDRNRAIVRQSGTPILSVCGGATDAMIASESCVLPADDAGVYRRTVFTSALEGAWTGVGHREMVWCDQVRWRVARAALELGIAPTADARARVLDRWLRDGRVLPSEGEPVPDASFARGAYEVLSPGLPFVLNRPLGKRTYLLPIPDDGDRTFGVYVSQGSVSGMSPHRVGDLRVSVRLCTDLAADDTVSCVALAPDSLQLLPSPVSGRPFPVPDQGADETEGMVFFESGLPRGTEGWVGVTVDAGDESTGWVVGGLDQTRRVGHDLGLWDLLLGGVHIPLPRSDDVGSRTIVSLARLPATALLAYRLVPNMADSSSCAAPLFSPLLAHASRGSEIHYHPLVSGRPVFLHTHSSAPYVRPTDPGPSLGLDFTIHSPGPGCQDVTEVLLSIDWWASVGRIGTRYPTTLLSWGVGIVSLLLFHSWSVDGQHLSVGESLGVFVRRRMPALMAVAAVIASFPMGPDYYLGIGDELGVLRAVLAVLLVCVATGMACVSWWLLEALLWPLRWMKRGSVQRTPEDHGLRRSRVISMVLVLGLIWLFVPWQVAFLGCWVVQLLNCDASVRSKAYPGSVPTLASTPTDEDEDLSGHAVKPAFANADHQSAHLLLLMTWLLPLVAPVLVVWVRTVQTAGYTTPFDGDHNALKVAPVLVLVDLLGRGRPLDTTWVRWGWVVVAVVSFACGGRRAGVVYDAASAQMAVFAVCQARRVIRSGSVRC